MNDSGICIGCGGDICQECQECKSCGYIDQVDDLTAWAQLELEIKQDKKLQRSVK